MALELKQSLKLGQQLVMTPQLQQAIRLLQLNRLELVEAIDQELQENPVLEEADQSISGEKTEDPSEEKLLSQDRESEDFNWEAYMEEYNNYTPSGVGKEVPEEVPRYENILTKTESLEEHLLWQLSMLSLSAEGFTFGKLLIGNVDQNGYLQVPLEELVQEASLTIEEAEKVHQVILKFDPVGAGARDLKECLLAQAELLSPRDELVESLIKNNLNLIEKKEYSKLAKTLQVSQSRLEEALHVLLSLDPKPGRLFESQKTNYIEPDIYIKKVGGKFVILLNEEGLPRLRVSPYYQSLLKKVHSKGTEKDEQAKQFVREKLKSALWLIRSLQHRQKTIYRVSEAIVKRQQGFLEKGIQHLKPMVLKDIAQDLGLHESTVSRVTTNKYMHTPQGLIELKYFFNSSLGSGRQVVSNKAVQATIQELIQNEDVKHPLSDQKIVFLLKKSGVQIARRTVAKYREILHILSSSKRRKERVCK